MDDNDDEVRVGDKGFWKLKGWAELKPQGYSSERLRFCSFFCENTKGRHQKKKSKKRDFGPKGR